MTQKLLVILIFLFSGEISQAQSTLLTDASSLMRIPEIVNMASSATHLYVLSETEGLVVFRTNTDTLQWMYSSEGMTSRGTQIQADIRFAYLYGVGNRLTVLEPTSLLGVYSSTTLPDRPLAVARAGTNLFIAMGRTGLGKLSLLTPSLFDNAPEMIRMPEMSGNIIDVKRLALQLVVLSDARELLFFDIEGDDLRHRNTVQLNTSVEKLHVFQETLHASNTVGDMFQIRSNGFTEKIYSVSESVDKAHSWEDFTLIRTRDGHLYFTERGGRPELLRSDRRGGNYFTIANNRLWLTNYDEVAINSLLPRQTNARTTTGSGLRILEINNMIVPFPRSVTLVLGTESPNTPDLRFQYRSEVNNAEIRGNGFFWQPQNSHIGVNRFTIIATNDLGQTDSTSFTIEVRTFNAPPRFNPVRPLAIAVGENFQLPIRALDPDGTDPDLIRYHGVDLPDGASISERTGMFSWTPDRRQAGIHNFQIIATDQYGAAASQPIAITVRNISREE
jgi:hypothetical protein